MVIFIFLCVLFPHYLLSNCISLKFIDPHFNFTFQHCHSISCWPPLSVNFSDPDNPRVWMNIGGSLFKSNFLLKGKLPKDPFGTWNYFIWIVSENWVPEWTMLCHMCYSLRLTISHVRFSNSLEKCMPLDQVVQVNEHHWFCFLALDL